MNILDHLSARQKRKYHRHAAHVRVRVGNDNRHVIAFPDVTPNAKSEPLRWSKR